MFNAETHFFSKAPKDASTSSNKDLKVWLGNTPYITPSVPHLSSEKMKYTNISLDVAKELNAMFNTNISQILKKPLNISLLSILSKMELIGALCSPLKHKEKIDPSFVGYSTGIIVNETKNTLAISINGVVKIFPKAMYNYFIYVEEKKYFLIGPALKIERKYTKGA